MVEESAASHHPTRPLMFFGLNPVARGRSRRGDIPMKCALVVIDGQSVFLSQSVTSLGLE
jgi:hypothetical protein